jgi:MFS family permease
MARAPCRAYNRVPIAGAAVHMLTHYLGLPRAVHILCLGTFVNRAGTFLIPFLTLYLRDHLGFSDRFATRTMGLYGLGSILAAALGGHLADWIGRRTVMLLSLFGGAGALALFANISSGWMVLSTVTAFGMIAEMYRPAAAAMIGDLVSPAHRPRAFGLMYVAINLGFAVGPFVGGLIAEYSFRLLFYCDAMTSAAYGVIILLAIRETLRTVSSSVSSDSSSPAPTDEAHVPLRSVIVHMLRDRPFQIFWLAGFLIAVSFMQSMSTFPLYLAEQGIGKATYGRLIAVNGILIVLLQLPLTSLLARFERGRVVMVASLVIGLGFGLTAIAQTPWQYAATIVVWTLGEIAQASYMFAIVTDLAPPAMRGRYLGMFGMSYAVAMTLGVPLGGEMLTRFGGDVVWLGCGVCGMMSAGLFWSIRKHMRPRDHAAMQMTTGGVA